MIFHSSVLNISGPNDNRVFTVSNDVLCVARIVPSADKVDVARVARQQCLHREE